MILFGLNGLALITMGLGVAWTSPIRPIVLTPQRVVDTESIVFTDISEGLEINE